jgi:hypothetical protein
MTMEQLCTGTESKGLLYIKLEDEMEEKISDIYLQAIVYGSYQGKK